MKLEEYRIQLKGDADYRAAARELKPILDLADEILRLRLERGWSQSELARRVGTKQANISRIEAGLGNPTFKFIQKVARALDTELAIRFEAVDSQAHDTLSVIDEFTALAERYFNQATTTNASGTSGPEEEADYTPLPDPPTVVRTVKECAQ